MSAPSRARSASDNSLKIYLYRYTNKTSDFEANFEKVYFQSTQKAKSPICYPYGPMYFPGKVWGHAVSVCAFYIAYIFMGLYYKLWKI